MVSMDAYSLRINTLNIGLVFYRSSTYNRKSSAQSELKL